jgi:hypothetical protein
LALLATSSSVAPGTMRTAKRSDEEEACQASRESTTKQQCYGKGARAALALLATSSSVAPGTTRTADEMPKAVWAGEESVTRQHWGGKQSSSSSLLATSSSVAPGTMRSAGQTHGHKSR